MFSPFRAHPFIPLFPRSQVSINESQLYIAEHRVDNRLGAVYSSVFGFWLARDAALRAEGRRAGRRDSYTVVLHNLTSNTIIENDISSTPQQLLGVLLKHSAHLGNNFDGALRTAESLVEKHWRNDQYARRNRSC